MWFWEVLVMEGKIGFLDIRIKVSYVEDSRQCLFSTFLLVISFLQCSGKISLTLVGGGRSHHCAIPAPLNPVALFPPQRLLLVVPRAFFPKRAVKARL